MYKRNSKGVMSGYSIPQDDEKDYETYPTKKTDLMKYYRYADIYPDDYQSIEMDIKSLVWLARINLLGELK